MSEIEVLDGVYPAEADIEGAFTWTCRQFTRGLPKRPAYLHLRYRYLGRHGILSCVMPGSGKPVELAGLQEGWQEVVFPVPEFAMDAGRLELMVEPAVTIPSDSREFGLCIRSVRPVWSAAEYAALQRCIANYVLNQTELKQGAVVLRSTPPRLRIDMESRCNMEPKCVYCSWEYTKGLEADNAARRPFSPSFFDELGAVYDNAVEVVNCSHGEVLLSPHFEAVVTRLAQDGKHFEFTTNGLLLDEAVRSLILGKDIFVYISVDAASAERFARYRNEQFGLVVDNVRRLCAAKRRQGTDYPKVFLSYILMRSNVAETDDFLALSRELGVDAVVFKTLDDYDNTNGVPQWRAGFAFNYLQERLNRQELQAAKQRIETVGQGGPIKLYFTFNAEPAKFKPCEELWQAVYIMERGFVPCCISRRPTFIDAGDPALPLAQQVEHVLNGSELQAMRADFAAGQVPRYCREIDCPHVSDRHAN